LERKVYLSSQWKVLLFVLIAAAVQFDNFLKVVKFSQNKAAIPLLSGLVGKVSPLFSIF